MPKKKKKKKLIHEFINLFFKNEITMYTCLFNSPMKFIFSFMLIIAHLNLS